MEVERGMYGVYKGGNGVNGWTSVSWGEQGVLEGVAGCWGGGVLDGTVGLDFLDWAKRGCGVRIGWWV